MQIVVNVKKRHFYFLVALFMFLAGFVIVLAYNSKFDKGSDSGATLGHSADEVVVKMSDDSYKTVQELLSDNSKDFVQIYCMANSTRLDSSDYSIAKYEDIVTDRNETGSCPDGYRLISYAIDYYFGRWNDWNDNQDKEVVVEGNYTSNIIICRIFARNAPAIVGGVGLCAKIY